MPEKRRRSPAEKKALSYAKDRRNNYGENDKASRKNIPRNKAKGHRADRRKAASALSGFENMSEEDANLIENALVTDLDRLQRWQKCPDQPLADHVKEQQARREYRYGRKQWSKKKRDEAIDAGHSGFAMSWRGDEDDSFFEPR